LEVKVPERKFKDEPAEISPMAECAWYEWFKFRDTSFNSPCSKILLGRYFGAAIDIGPAVACKVLNIKGNFFYRTSARSLTSGEIHSPSETRARLAFAEVVEKKCGPSMMKDDFKDDTDFADVVTPTFAPYDD
jgi:hypothetical protein